MDHLKRHAIWTAVAAIVGIAGVAWLQPATSGGTTLVIAVSLLIFNAVAAVGSVDRRPRQPSTGEPK
jgi:hypothetical protein